MSIDVLKAQFVSHSDECEKDRMAHTADIKELRAILDSKVSFKHFYWLVGIMIMLLTSVLGYIIIQIKDISLSIAEITNKTASVQSDVSFLKGKLSPFEVRYEK